jgi:hypothetical protein
MGVIFGVTRVQRAETPGDGEVNDPESIYWSNGMTGIGA